MTGSEHRDAQDLTASPSLLDLASHSRFVQRLQRRYADLLPLLPAGAPTRDSLTDALAALRARGLALDAALRVLRQLTLERLVHLDTEQQAPLDTVTRAMTWLAEVTLDAAWQQVQIDLDALHGMPTTPSGQRAELWIIGMGKLGGAELNASSDIDLVLVYPEEGDTDGGRPLSNHEFFTRLAKRLINALNEWTADGFVFRVDTRLRPYGDSGPLVVGFDMLENYLVTQGRPWERFAWIKGRVLTGDQGTALMAMVRPFVFRRHLDFSAFAAMRSLHSQVRHEVNRRDRLDNIKLGPGGIREIEFTVQVFQLIRGGREPALQQPATLPVLAALAEEAPGLDLEVVQWQPDFRAQLERGDIDLTVGFPKGDEPQVYARALFAQDWAVVLRRGHPALRKPWTAALFASLEHGFVSFSGRGGGQVDDALALLGRSRRVKVRVPYPLLSPMLAARSDLVVTTVRWLALELAKRHDLVVRKPPIVLARMHVPMVWHERAHNDPRQRWFRDLLARVASELDPKRLRW